MAKLTAAKNINHSSFITDMKTVIFSSLLLLITCLGADARSYASALKSARNKPVIIFAYPANFSDHGEKMYNEYFKRRKLLSVARNCVLVAIPVYQNPSKREKQLYERATGGLNPPMPRSLPGIVLTDSTGSIRGSMSDSDVFENLDLAKAELKRMLGNFSAQQKILSRVKDGTKKRDLDQIAEAASYDLALPNDVRARVSKADPHGIGLSMTGNVWSGALVELDKLDIDSAENYIRRMLSGGHYTKKQRQELLLALTGHMRRKDLPKNRLRALYYEIRNIDPTGHYASYAEEAIRIWLGEDPFRTEKIK